MLYLLWAITLEEVRNAPTENLKWKAIEFVASHPNQTSDAINIVIERMPETYGASVDNLLEWSYWIAEQDNTRIRDVVPHIIHAIQGEEDDWQMTELAVWLARYAPDRFNEITDNLIAFEFSPADGGDGPPIIHYEGERVYRIFAWMSMIARHDPAKIPLMAEKIIQLLRNENNNEAISWYLRSIKDFAPEYARQAADSLLGHMRNRLSYLHPETLAKFADWIVSIDQGYAEALVPLVLSKVSDAVHLNPCFDWLATYAPEQLTKVLIENLGQTQDLWRKKMLLINLYHYRNLLTPEQIRENFSHVPQEVMYRLRMEPKIYDFIQQVARSREAAELGLAQDSERSTLSQLPEDVHTKIRDFGAVNPGLTESFLEERLATRERGALQREEAQERGQLQREEAQEWDRLQREEADQERDRLQREADQERDKLQREETAQEQGEQP